MTPQTWGHPKPRKPKNLADTQKTQKQYKNLADTQKTQKQYKNPKNPKNPKTI
jgi:hypothetical protein